MRKVSLLAAVMACVLAFAGGMLTFSVVGQSEVNPALWAAPGESEDEELDDDGLVSLLMRTIDIIAQQSVRSVDEEELLRSAIEGVISSLDDPYAELMDKDDLDALMEDYREHGYSGIGIQITAVSEGAQVLEVFSDSPAEGAGIEMGDIITEVDGESIAGMRVDEVGSLIRGEPGTEVQILLLRDDEEVGPVAVQREDVVRPTMTYERIEIEGKDLGYISIGRFAEGTPDEFARALEKMEGADGLLIDVRGNPGGTLSAAISVTEHLVPEGPILVTEGRGGEVLSEFESETPGVDVPVTVLTDEFTASGAEILAGAARDRLDALLVGMNTYGKGSVQSVFDLEDAGLRLTTAEFVLPSGHRIGEQGLIPDVQILRTAGVSPGTIHVPEEPLSQGDRGPAVQNLTERLRQLGYIDTPAGRHYDADVRRAVGEFQRDAGLKVTGRADEETLKLMADKTGTALDPLLEYLKEDASEEILEKEWLLRDRQRLQGLRALVGWMTLY